MGFKIEDIVHPDAHNVAKPFECGVCLCILDEPVQTVCDHIFCKDCVADCLACPTCRTAFTAGDRKPLRECNRPLLRIMHDLKVWCPYHAESKYEAPEAARARQADPEASAAAAASPSGASSAAAPVESAAAAGGEAASAEARVGFAFGSEVAEEGLPARKRARLTAQTSMHCEWKGSYTDLLAKHLGECPLHFVPCPRGCGETCRRRELECHAAVCSKNFEECWICKEQVRHGSMYEHRKSKAELHVQILEAKLLEKDGDSVEIGLADLRTKLASLESASKAGAKTQYVKVRVDDLKEAILSEMRLHASHQQGFDEQTWVIKRPLAQSRSHPKGRFLRSPPFYLKGAGPFYMEFYPNGADNSDEGRCAFYIAGPAGVAAKLQVTIAGKVVFDWKEYHVLRHPMGHENTAKPAYTDEPLTIIVECLGLRNVLETP